MNHLPWKLSPVNPEIILDKHGCMVLNLSNFHAVGAGQDRRVIAEFIVSKANETQEES
jgi:hypothetical protein